MKTLEPITKTNIKHSQTPSQINVKPHTKGLNYLSTYSLTEDGHFQQKLQRQRKTAWRDKANNTTSLKYDTDVDIIRPWI